MCDCTRNSISNVSRKDSWSIRNSHVVEKKSTKSIKFDVNNCPTSAKCAQISCHEPFLLQGIGVYIFPGRLQDFAPWMICFICVAIYVLAIKFRTGTWVRNCCEGRSDDIWVFGRVFAFKTPVNLKVGVRKLMPCMEFVVFTSCAVVFAAWFLKNIYHRLK